MTTDRDREPTDAGSTSQPSRLRRVGQLIADIVSGIASAMRGA